MKLFELTASEAIEKMVDEEISSEELIASCLGQIETKEADIGAWSFWDKTKALEQAQLADRRRNAHWVERQHCSDMNKKTKGVV
jgi:Asp-tRNA(Asn)/Glu-tRNA(Gln) amidotransferase A subunit family amidase